MTDRGLGAEAPRPSRRRRIGLWAVALVIMLGAAAYQRLTGPTHPMRARFELGGEAHVARLVRSGTTGEAARVEVPAPAGEVAGTLHFKRYPTNDEFTALEMARKEDRLVGRLPSQPPAGKVEYFVEVERGGERARLPATAEDNPVLRFKDAVPLYVLLPHVIVMFLSMLVGVRAGLAALFAPGETRPLAWVALGGLTLGGLVLGPIAQKLAFGEFWTGWPRGYDLTDNKVLVMWIVWLGACLVLGRRTARPLRARRWVVVGAAVVMLVVYLIPHSLRGSELDYDRLEEGVPAEDAIRTG